MQTQRVAAVIVVGDVVDLVIAVATLLSPIARGDGDPASDTLLEQSVYFPYSAPSQAAATALQQTVDDVYAHGDRVKVVYGQIYPSS